jgi:hypothetical protein
MLPEIGCHRATGFISRHLYPENRAIAENLPRSKGGFPFIKVINQVKQSITLIKITL